MQLTREPQNICIFGLGYVGSVTASSLASLGHRVTGVDRDEFKVRQILEKRAPFYEPGLDELIEQGVSSGRLRAITETGEGMREADIALVCVGTPSERNGNLGLDQLRRVLEAMRQTITPGRKPLIVAIRSTVFPGTCEEIVEPVFADCPGVSVVSNPEFLREGAAVKDFLEPSLVVVGGKNRAAVEQMARVYDPLGVRPSLVSLRTAEMIKYACNAYHAVKVCFANEIGSLAAELGIDPQEVMGTLCQDTKLNVSAAYLRPGFAFGGSCLPKDLRALNYRATTLDLELPLLKSALPSNFEQLRRGIDTVMAHPGRTGFVGLAFKENTDDLRESPVLTMLEHLLGKGRALRVWDPHISLGGIYGSNKNFALNAIPHIGGLLIESLDELLGWAEVLVVTQKPSPGAVDQIKAAGRPVIDLAGTRLF